MRPLLLLFFSWAVFAQGTAPKGTADAYPVHAQARSAALGAEFMIHTISAGGQAYFIKGFLVVEVALFPPNGRSVDVHSGNFVMRINGHKQEILPQPSSVVASVVASAAGHPEWPRQPRMATGAGAAPAAVNLGQPRPTQVPGMPVPGQTPLPDAPHGRVKPEQVVLDTALPQGEHRTPVSGFLYFAWNGKTSSIRSLELRYEDAVLKLR